MPAPLNRRITLAARPAGEPKASDFALDTGPVPEPDGGEMLVRALWLSLDPYQRGRLSAARSYAPSVEVGGVVEGGVVGRVERSRKPGFVAGDIVEGRLGWQEYALSDGAGLRKVDPALGPVSTALGVLGMPGLTAWFGLFDVGRPSAGDTVVVSAAAGAVGQVVGQLARLAGCRVVGIAGGREKIDYVTGELGFHGGIDRREEDLGPALDRACPDGVDVYFDNVGGAVADAVLSRLALRARMVVCGQISQYNRMEPELAPRDLMVLVRRRARIEGFLVGDYRARHEEARRRLAGWVADGSLRYREDVVDGLENAPEAFIGLLRGANFGKLLVRVADGSS